MSLRRGAKRAFNVAALVLMAAPALTCAIGAMVGTGESVFALWAQTCALVPGVPGVFLRRAFYRWTLRACAEDVTIEFGAVLQRRASELARGVYIGSYALIGWVRVGENSLIGSRVSVLSGGKQHELAPSGEWTATSIGTLRQIAIGRNTWIGEGAVVMADLGSGCMVAAGTVVSSAVPDGIMVAGNPARFVRHLTPERPTGTA